MKKIVRLTCKILFKCYTQDIPLPRTTVLILSHQNKEQTYTSCFLRRNQDLTASPSHFCGSGKAQSICCSYSNTSCEKTFCSLGSSKQKIPVRNPVRMSPLTGHGLAQRMQLLKLQEVENPCPNFEMLGGKKTQILGEVFQRN